MPCHISVHGLTLIFWKFHSDPYSVVFFQAHDTPFVALYNSYSAVNSLTGMFCPPSFQLNATAVREIASADTIHLIPSHFASREEDIWI
jgi:hypothetical protein